MATPDAVVKFNAATDSFEVFGAVGLSGGGGGGDVTSADLASAIAAHNTSGAAHEDIRQAVTDEASARASAIATHNGDTLAHGDIRQLVLDEAGLRAAAVTAQSNALTSAVSGLTASIGEVNTALGGKLDASAAAGFAPINSPQFTGIPKAPTPTTVVDGKEIATTGYARWLAAKLETWVRDNFDDGGVQPPPIIWDTIMGARWFKNQPATTLERLYESVGLNFTPAVNGVGGSSDFDTMPVYRDIKLCNLVDGVVTAYYGEPGFSRTPAQGDVMVEIPKYYYKIVEDTDTRDYLVSDKQIDNTWFVSPRHAPTSENPNGWEKIYVSAYILNSNYQSVSGGIPQVGNPRATARTNCANRGAGYSQYDFATYWTINLLYLIEVANWDSKVAVGVGNMNSTPSSITAGNSDNILFHSGATGNIGSFSTAKYRHIENLWSRISMWVDGININGVQSYISLIPSQYQDDTANNYAALSYTNAATNQVFIKRLGFDANYPFAQICVEGGGSDTTYIPDRYYRSSGWRGLSVGGYWNYMSYHGLFSFHADTDSISTGVVNGCRLICLPD